MEINLDRVRNALGECVDLVDRLHGIDLDATRMTVDQSKGDARRQRAEIALDLQLLATRFELAAALTRIEYWTARGESDPLDPTR